MIRCIGLLALVGCGRIAFAPLSTDAMDTGSCALRHDDVAMVPVVVSPRAIVTGDVDGDRHPDFVTSSLTGQVSVVLGNGDGTFRPHVDYPVGNAPYSLAVGDVNGDGHLDIAVGNYADDSVSILLGTGTGTFGAQVVHSIAPFQSPQFTALTDMNGDGRLDLLTAASKSSGITESFGNGDGTFGTAAVYVAGSTPDIVYAVVAADFDADGVLDAAAVNSDEGTIHTFHGTGSTLATAGNFPTGQGVTKPWDIRAADLDGDGKVDLAVANNYSTSTIGIRRGIGNGNFQPVQEFPASGTPWMISVAELTGDGILDLAVADGLEDTTSVFPGRGDATFAPRIVYPGGNMVDSVATADFNGDGRTDIASPNAGDANVIVRLGACR